jgi:zeaxanthin glucosyltransferase
VSRFLFVVPPLTGHVHPATAVAAALTARGHDVAWAGPESFLRTKLGADATIYPTGLRLYRGHRPGEGSAEQSFLDGYVVPLARFTLSAVDRAVQEYRPDVVVADQHAVAGTLA